MCRSSLVRSVVPVVASLISLWLLTTSLSGEQNVQPQPLTGRVVDSNGKPLSDTVVHVVRQLFAPFRQSVLKTTTNADGNFRIDRFAVPGQRLYVRTTVCTDGHLLTWKFLKLQSGDKLEPLQFKLAPAREITFQIVDSSGAALPGVRVIPKQRESPDGNPHIVFTQSATSIAKVTDSEGRIKFNLFNNGDVVTLAILDGAYSQQKPLKIFNADREFQVKFAKRPGARAAPGRSRFALPELAETNAAHVKWVAANAIRFNTIDPANESFEDLQPLKAVLGSARIVMLGEQSHGDGACFKTKIRLIKFLHQHMGFDVIAFESGLFDCHVAWQDFVAGKPAQMAARQRIFGIWTASKQVQLLFDYLSKQASGKSPLKLAGFDSQFTAGGSLKLAQAIREFTSKLGADVATPQQLEAVCTTIDALIRQRPGQGQIADFQASMDRLSATARSIRKKRMPTSGKRSFGVNCF